MPRKKLSETANAEAENKSAPTTSKSNTTPKATRKRRTADEILNEAPVDSAESTSKPVESKPKTRRNATTAAEKPVKKTATAKATLDKPKVRRAEPEPVGIKKPSTPKAKTLAEELEEEKRTGKSTARIPKQPVKAAPKAAESKETAKPAPKTKVQNNSKSTTPAEKPKASRTKTESSSTETAPAFSFRSKTKSSAELNSANKKSRASIGISKGFDKPVELTWRASGEDFYEEPQNETEDYEELESPITEPIDLGDPEKRVQILQWRTTKTKKSAEEKAFVTRKSQSKSKKNTAQLPDENEDSITNQIEDQEITEKVKPILPTPIVREPIDRREEAAQVIMHEGHPKIIKDKLVYAPFFFYSGKLEGRTEARVSEQIKLAVENNIGVYMLQHNLLVNNNHSVESKSIIDQIIKLIAIAPDAQIIIRIHFTAGDNWKDEYPSAVDKSARPSSNLPSLSDDKYWSDAEKCLVEFIQELTKSSVANSILGVHLDRNQWQFETEDGHDTSDAAQTKFREWLRIRYRNDAVTLRASWFDGQVNFENACIPEPGFTETINEFVRTDRRARRWIDYHLFLSDVTVERIGELCYAAKSASAGEYLVGTTYGSTFESSHPASGQLSLGKLLRCPELDYISGQSNPQDSGPGQTAGFPFPVDSFALNGKLFLLEERYRTPISGTSDEDDPNAVMRTPQALEAAHWRGAGAALAHKGGVIWCDQDAKGWLNSRGIWERAGQVRESLLKNMAVATQSPEVAVFIDERSLSYLADERSFAALVQNVRESVLRSGLSVGFYLISDLAHRENFPESKLHVFVNAWDLRPEVRSAIKSRLQRDNKVLFWLYTAGLFESGRETLERVREVTGIALRPQPFNSKSGTNILNTKDSLGAALPVDAMAKGCGLEPSYFAIPEDGQIIAEYISTGLPSLLVKPFKAEPVEMSWTSVFLGEPIVTPAFLRALGQLAGCHVWNFENDVVHASAPSLSVHCTETGSRTLTLPSKWVAYNIATQEYMPVENNTVKFKALDGSTATFVVGTIGDVQNIINNDFESNRRIASPIIRNENTLKWDTVSFDVEIMRLDEWVEESWTEEMADDLLLKPSLLEVDSEALLEEVEPTVSRDSSGRRRRRKRRGDRDDRRDFKRESAEQQAEDAIGVLFRKRD